MSDIQEFYHKKPLQSLQLKVGSHVMARHRKDNVIYRARILGCNQMLRKYKVLFVDFGNQSAVTSEDIWQVEKRFANFPIMAYLCGFYGIVSNYDHLYMIDRMDQYLPQGAILQCEYIECNSRDLYYVNVNVNKVPLKETLLAEGLITQISPELGGIATKSFNTLLTKCDGAVKVEIVGEQEFDATNSCIVVRLFAANTEENIFENLHKALAFNNKNAQIITTNPFLESFQKTCVISHAISPMKFFIQLKSNSPKMDLITKTLKNAINIESLKPLDRPEVGRVCVTYSTEDECYCRGRVTRVLDKEEGFEIFLLDYGNFLISQDIREMPIDLYSIPSLALNCQLNSIPSVSNEEEESLLNECFLSLLETHFGEIYEIQTEQYDEEKKTYYVKLQVNYKDLAEELTRTFGLRKANKIEETFSPLPTLHNCSVIHVNSTQSFYVQFNDDIASLEHITDALLDAAEEFPVFTELKVGALCVAQFPDDGAYYRAEIISVLEGEEAGKCEVHYLDFGNNSITDQFRQLPPELLKKERFSQHCSLEATCPPNEEVNQTFINLIDQRFSETFQLEFLKKSESLNIVRLFYQEKNILHEMQQLLRGQLLLQAAQEVNGFFSDKEGNASD
uniref:Tudor domain-containing protein n=1 Tax=Glossina austeni TaxID=7395 RepID=A0A1A9URB8_GLOAU